MAKSNLPILIVIGLIIIGGVFYFKTAQTPDQPDADMTVYVLNANGERVQKLTLLNSILSPLTTLILPGAQPITGVSNIEILAVVENPSSSQLEIKNINLVGEPPEFNQAIKSEVQGFSLKPGERKEVSIKPIDITKLPLGNVTFTLKVRGKYLLTVKEEEAFSEKSVILVLKEDPTGALTVNLGIPNLTQANVTTTTPTTTTPTTTVPIAGTVKFRTNALQGADIPNLDVYKFGTQLVLDHDGDGSLDPFAFNSASSASAVCGAQFSTSVLCKTRGGISVVKTSSTIRMCINTGPYSSTVKIYTPITLATSSIPLSTLPTEPYKSSYQEINN